MRAELISFGFLVSGPHGEHWVATLDDANAKVTELSVAENFDGDDYTVTEVFAKAWRGSVNSIPHPGAGYDWDDVYKEQS